MTETPKIPAIAPLQGSPMQLVRLKNYFAARLLEAVASSPTNGVAK